MKFKITLVNVSLLMMPVYADSEIVLEKGMYEVHATISLPHLQESLIKTETIETRCLEKHSANELFPILKHPSFTGCSLKDSFIKESELENKSLALQLQCKNNDAATGQASFTILNNKFSAQLDIKMGAKNMTMTQFLYATKIGECNLQ